MADDFAPGMIPKSALTDDQRSNALANLASIDAWLDEAVDDMTAHTKSHTHDPADPLDRVCCGVSLTMMLATMRPESAKMALQIAIGRLARHHAGGATDGGTAAE